MLDRDSDHTTEPTAGSWSNDPAAEAVIAWARAARVRDRVLVLIEEEDQDAIPDKLFAAVREAQEDVAKAVPHSVLGVQFQLIAALAMITDPRDAEADRLRPHNYRDDALHGPGPAMVKLLKNSIAGLNQVGAAQH